MFIGSSHLVLKRICSDLQSGVVQPLLRKSKPAWVGAVLAPREAIVDGLQIRRWREVNPFFGFLKKNVGDASLIASYIAGVFHDGWNG